MRPSKKEIAVGFLSAAVIFFTLFFAGIFILGDPVLHQALAFSQTAHYILADYHLPVVSSSALDGAERALLSLLDPFSQRLSKNDYRQLREELSGEYGGVGISIIPRDTFLMVTDVLEGGPAYEGGIRSGDRIIAVDGRDVSRQNPSDAADLIRGPSGTTVNITIYRPRIDDTLQMTLTRSSIKLEHIPYFGMTENRCAYIRVADFEVGAAAQLKEAIEELEPQRPLGYIIDLRTNPGGYLGEAIEAADIFLDKGSLIVGVDSRLRWNSRRFAAASHPLTARDVVILTDRGTASGAEIFTGALRGADKAVVVGDTTFGKGLVQSVYPLFNGDAIRLTISRYYFADGTYLNPPDSELTFSGLPPDIPYFPQGEIAFRDFILYDLLIYDFVDTNRDLLSRYPDRFNYPDEVVELFESFVESQGIEYQSRSTEILKQAILNQFLDEASEVVLAHLDSMLAYSKSLDENVFTRHKDFLKYHIRRIMVERERGGAASYRDVIVPGRADIRLAEALLADPDRYQSYLTRRTDTD